MVKRERSLMGIVGSLAFHLTLFPCSKALPQENQLSAHRAEQAICLLGASLAFYQLSKNQMEQATKKGDWNGWEEASVNSFDVHR